MIQDTWVWPDPPTFLQAQSDLQEEGLGSGGRRKGALSRVNQEVGMRSSEQHTNFQLKKVCLVLSPANSCWGNLSRDTHKGKSNWGTWGS